MANESYTQIGADGVGRKIESLPVTVPAGTVVTNTDGTKTELTADTIVFRQGMVLANPSVPGQFAEVIGEEGRGGLVIEGRSVAVLEEINAHITEILNLLQLTLEN